ncbi:putative gamma-glutamylcyclotransferase CG2811 [Mercenaria mercenaria]|uniref:putative gamma-glutamylcyclotransferase CG2811 n=1 Tax=Mercenaria mercenaria TaxID=6596 RepID=UPI00234EBA60|nr:putative gamma-glutamylcyclotransferase CG2811 [Mercenaria mercenaria]XP_053408214.1 putative gamma-glutamylcyclotransferase CG2811 [Mercenaria mercenaria]
MAETYHKVFVYGTLKKGQPNEYFMNMIPSVEYLGTAETRTKYPLIIGGEWNLPMLLNREGEGKTVKGEVYRVDKDALERLDQFEGHPDFYERTEIDVNLTNDDEVLSTVKCWTYFIKDYSEKDVKQEHFSLYDSAGCHGLVYDARENDEHPSQS